jgi:hypothetical protein
MREGHDTGRRSTDSQPGQSLEQAPEARDQGEDGEHHDAEGTIHDSSREG